LLKVLIVDDEEWTRISLREAIDWASLGMEICGEACNGQAAIELMHSARPEIVITDIRMPVMDGLRLIERLDTEYPETLVILLSGFSDFEYAKKVIQHRAFDYALKPIDEEQLSATLVRAAIKLIEDKSRHEDLIGLQIQLNEIGMMPKEKFLTNLLTGEAGSPGEIRQAVRKYGIRLEGPIFAAAVLRASNFRELTEDKYKADAELASFVLLNLASELLQKDGESLVFRTNGKQNEVVFITVLPESIEGRSGEEISSVLLPVVTKAVDTVGFKLLAGISGEFAALTDLRHAYKQAAEALRNIAIMNRGPIIHIDEVAACSENYVQPEDQERAFLYYLEQGYKTQALIWVDDLFLQWERADHIRPDSIRETLAELTIGIRKQLKKRGVDMNGLSNHSESESLVWNGMWTLAQLKSWFSGIVSEAADRIADSRKIGSRRAVLDIVSYLHNHYGEEVSLYAVSETHFLNPAYLSRLFKQETGHTFNEYLSGIRMEAAARLLTGQEDYKVNDIAVLVGYENGTYFMRKFKEYFKMTPSEYRRSHSQHGQDG
jgi:two-component system response regulator YesN